jgi:hypothetical protein
VRQLLINVFAALVALTVIVASAPHANAAPSDFNGNLTSDVLFDSISGTTNLLLKNGFTPPSATVILGAQPTWHFTHVADFNGYGRADILWRNNDGSVVTWFMNGNMIGGAIGLLGADRDWRVSDVADFNGDGKADLIWRHADGSIFAYLMNGLTVSSGAYLANAGTGLAVWPSVSSQPIVTGTPYVALFISQRPPPLNAVQPSPNNKIPACAVPKFTKQHRNHQTRQRPRESVLITTERDV